MDFRPPDSQKAKATSIIGGSQRNKPPDPNPRPKVLESDRQLLAACGINFTWCERENQFNIECDKTVFPKLDIPQVVYQRPETSVLPQLFERVMIDKFKER